MSGRRYRRRGGNSLGSVVDDSVRVAARFGPVGALTTGAIGFAIFYAALPITLLAWADANKVKLVGPAAAAFANRWCINALARICGSAPCSASM